MTKRRTFYGDQRILNCQVIFKTFIHGGTNNIDTNSPEDIANGLICCAVCIAIKHKDVNIYITGLLARDLNETHRRINIKKVNDLLKRKCSTLCYKKIKYVNQEDDWVDQNKKLFTKYFYKDHLHLIKPGNRKFSKLIITALKEQRKSIIFNNITKSTPKTANHCAKFEKDFPRLSSSITQTTLKQNQSSFIKSQNQVSYATCAKKNTNIKAISPTSKNEPLSLILEHKNRFFPEYPSHQTIEKKTTSHTKPRLTKKTMHSTKIK